MLATLKVYTSWSFKISAVTVGWFVEVYSQVFCPNPNITIIEHSFQSTSSQLTAKFSLLSFTACVHEKTELCQYLQYCRPSCTTNPATLTLLCLHWWRARDVPSRTLINMHTILEFLVVIFNMNCIFEYTGICMTH